MKAWCAHRCGEPSEVLELSERPLPDIGPGFALVENHVIGLSYADVLMCRGEYQFQVSLPYVPGGETVGVVRQVAEPEEFGHLVGARVFGLGGGLEEFSGVPCSGLFPLEDDVEAATAVAVPVNYCTADYCLDDICQIQPGQVVLVLGASGGVGSAAVDLAKLYGATVVAVVGGETKAAVCAAQGCADIIIDHSSEASLRDAVMAATAGAGVDACIDPVGGNLTGEAVRCIKYGGIHSPVGFASGTIPQLGLNHLFMKGYRVAGANWGAFILREPDRVAPSVERMLKLLEAGRLHPIVSVSDFVDGSTSVVAHARRTSIGKHVVRIR